ncbi:alpha-ketoacid dehydrogenase subunit beta [Candidatus Omnitrophota bacterium]
MWDLSFSERSEFERACQLAHKSLRGLTYKEAITEAIWQVMEKDPSVFIMGEGVDHCGWIFGTTKGLGERFGKNRAFDTPIAENTITGIASGAGLCGLKPIIVHARMDFLMLAMDQIINHASKMRYMSGGRVRVPLVVRTMIGGGWGSAAQHSQGLQAFFAHAPGLKVVMPSTPYDLKGLFVSSIRSKDPVIFIETKFLYEHVGYVPKRLYSVDFGKGAIRREGSDVTICAISYMVYEAIKASDSLRKDGIKAEVIDLRSLRPLDEEIILKSVKKTHRLVVCDNAWKTCGFSAEISAIANEKAFRYLKAPIKRVALPDIPTPASPALEKAFYPKARDIIKAVKKVYKFKRKI